jgi:hemerythrin-like metal-binding protein
MTGKLRVSKSKNTGTRITLQHNKLHDQIESINTAIRNHLPHEKLVSLVLEIQQNFASHFATEEALMAEINYPKSRTLQHKAAHLEASHQLDNLATYLSLKNIPPRNVFEFLFDWSYVHELNEDKQLSAFLEESGISL